MLGDDSARRHRTRDAFDAEDSVDQHQRLIGASGRGSGGRQSRRTPARARRQSGQRQTSGTGHGRGRGSGRRIVDGPAASRSSGRAPDLKEFRPLQPPAVRSTPSGNATWRAIRSPSPPDVLRNAPCALGPRRVGREELTMVERVGDGERSHGVGQSARGFLPSPPGRGAGGEGRGMTGDPHSSQSFPSPLTMRSPFTPRLLLPKGGGRRRNGGDRDRWPRIAGSSRHRPRTAALPTSTRRGRDELKLDRIIRPRRTTTPGRPGTARRSAFPPPRAVPRPALAHPGRRR